MRIRKAAPRIWFEDAADAHQAGATAILQGREASEAESTLEIEAE